MDRFHQKVVPYFLRANQQVSNYGGRTVPELPPRYAFRLEDVRAWHLVEASCRRCRHRAPVDHQLLLRGRPLYTRLYDIERALRCLRCGALGQARPIVVGVNFRGKPWRPRLG